jgi:hypothetical protein
MIVLSEDGMVKRQRKRRGVFNIKAREQQLEDDLIEELKLEGFERCVEESLT